MKFVAENPVLMVCLPLINVMLSYPTGRVSHSNEPLYRLRSASCRSIDNRHSLQVRTIRDPL